jgi:hypothetical protein
VFAAQVEVRVNMKPSTITKMMITAMTMMIMVMMMIIVITISKTGMRNNFSFYLYYTPFDCQCTVKLSKKEYILK